jgi:hypothetical protein
LAKFAFEGGVDGLHETPNPSCDLPPDGQISDFSVQPLSEKYSDFPKTQITLYPSPSRSSEGRCATSRNAERDAVDAGSALDGRRGWRTAKACGPDAPTLASSLRQHPQAMVARKPGHQGERVISRKTIARGMPGDSGVT